MMCFFKDTATTEIYTLSLHAALPISDHPQLGRVEVGGWKTKFTHQNPPPTFLEGECEKLARFAIAHASAAPRLADRKSTRLNSSHANISYAVFCLNKHTLDKTNQ